MCGQRPKPVRIERVHGRIITVRETLTRQTFVEVAAGQRSRPVRESRIHLKLLADVGLRQDQPESTQHFELISILG